MNKKEIVKIAKTNLAELTGFDSPKIRNIAKENRIWRATVNITEEFLETSTPEIVWTYDVLVDLAGNFRGYSKIRGRKKHKNTIRKSFNAKDESLRKYLTKNAEYSRL